MDYRKEHPASFRMAVQLVQEAAARAPSFIMLRMVLLDCIEKTVASEENRELVKKCAAQYLSEQGH